MADVDQWFVNQIVSGGQTGVDRAALDWARQREVVHGGWFPKGRLAADGPLLGGGDYFGPDASKEQQEVDFYHWSAILRSVSGFEIYRKVYRNVIHPEKVAELLILRPDMPRSLAACMNEAVANLELVANQQSSETLRRAGRLQSDLRYGRIDEILATGLHAYLTQFLDRVGDLGVGISRDFLVPMAA